MTLGELLAREASRLAQAGLERPRAEAEILAAHVLACPRLTLLVDRGREVTGDEEGRVTGACALRAQGVPSAHITGHREFYGRDFTVTPATLIPRPETELLVEEALAGMAGRGADAPVRFADIGAGTGCVGITLCLERPAWEGVLLEKEADAALVAARNARALGAVNARVVGGDLFAPPLARGLDLIVSNPPYIAESERPSLMREVVEREPATALFSSRGGLAHLEAVTTLAARLLAHGGMVAVEHGMGQGAAVRAMMNAAGLGKIVTKKDLSGLDRVTVARI